MPDVLGGHPFALENVTKVPTAIRTDNFNTTAIGILVSCDSTRNLIVETGPSAMAVELSIRAIQR